MDASGRWPFWPELVLNEILVVEVILRQVQSIDSCLLGPAGSFIRAAFGTGFGIGGDVGTAIGASIRGHKP
jgi:hypothetical protein